MADQVDIVKAQEVYNTLCSILDSKNFNYEKEEEKLLISIGFKGDDLPLKFLLVVNPKSQVIQFLSFMPFEVPEDKRVDGALAVCVANYGLGNGSFDYDLSDGTIVFRLTSSYRDTVLTTDLFDYMLAISAGTVDRYNDKFFMIAKNMMSIQQFIEQENS